MDQFEYGFKVIFNMRPQFGFGNNRRRGKRCTGCCCEISEEYRGVL